MNVPHGGCEGVGWAACLERSRWGLHAWESHVVPTRADPRLLQGGFSSGAGVPSKLEQGYCRERLEQLHGTYPPPQTPRHCLPVARSTGANTTPALQPILPTFQSGD